MLPSQSLLFPLVNVLQFAAACHTVGPVLKKLTAALVSAGRPAVLVERYAACDSPDAVAGLLAARAKADVLGAVFTLEIEEWLVVRGCTSHPFTLAQKLTDADTSARASQSPSPPRPY